MIVFSRFGEPVVAAFSIIDRIIPVAFGVLFAMSGAIGPVIGQNFGARAWSRVSQTMSKSFLVAIIYVAVVWLLLWLFSEQIVVLFHAQDETARLVIFFCNWCGAAWMGLGCLFVANSAFNNLGYPMLSTAFNWGRATLGTIPFVYFGSQIWGPEGAQMGLFLGAIIFGIAAIISAFWVTNRLQDRAAKQPV
jgi:Na+-driven multidrug efflux pump